MASKYQSKAAAHVRRKQNRGIAHGTTRMGKGGRALRTYNAKTARWEKTNPYGPAGGYRAPKTSDGSMKTSGSPVTETKGVKVYAGRQQRASDRRLLTAAAVAAPFGVSGILAGKTSYGKSFSQGARRNSAANWRRSQKDMAKKASSVYNFGRSVVSSAERFYKGY